MLEANVNLILTNLLNYRQEMNKFCTQQEFPSLLFEMEEMFRTQFFFSNANPFFYLG